MSLVATDLLIGICLGAVCFLSSERLRKQRGFTPWHWPSWAWGAVGLVFGLIGVLLMVIARGSTSSTTYGAVQASPYMPVYGGPSVPPNGQYPMSQTPSYGVGPGASWYTDPSGRYAARYWDGNCWTEHVSDGSSTAVDPL
jgi:Protein of unknown function (DUF2510)